MPCGGGTSPGLLETSLIGTVCCLSGHGARTLPYLKDWRSESWRLRGRLAPLWSPSKVQSGCCAGPYTAVAVGPNADVEAARAWQRPGSELLWALLPAGARHSLYVVHLGYNDVISAYARSGGPCRTAPSHRRQAALSGMRVTEPQQAVKSLLLKVAIGIGQAQTSWLDCNVVHPGGTVREGGKADSMAWRGPEAKA